MTQRDLNSRENFNIAAEKGSENLPDNLDPLSLSLTDCQTPTVSLRHSHHQRCPTDAFSQFSRCEIEQSIGARFTQQVHRHPQRIAIQSNNHRLTYQDLNKRSNLIAQKIYAIISQVSARIALLFEHDAIMIAAILGVLKSGNTYVPLDPNYPKDRLLYILNDASVNLLLTNNLNWQQAQKLTSTNLIIINVDDLSSPKVEEVILPEISPDAIAYLLYTSGSTGQPKGVIQNHRNVLHFIRNYTNNLHINSRDKLTLLASYGFDASVMGIFGALLNGATLCLFDIRQDGIDNLPQWIEKQGITIYHSTPTVFRYFLRYSRLDSDQKYSFDAIRLVVLGGEEVVKQDIELYQHNFSDHCLFINGFGPTESTITLQYFLDKNTEITRNTVPIGYPVEDTEIILFDEQGEPTDTFGEIAIRSRHLALGYWQKPELTAAVFLQDPEGGDRRIYRTGDWGRLGDNGALEFIGRKDFQVKIRGFRIELGEIEAPLNRHSLVRESVVMVRVDGTGDKRLVAYIVPHPSASPFSENNLQKELITHLQQQLPDYMVPSAFIFLDDFPLTPTYKIDRLALPTPDWSQLGGRSYAAPRNPSEETLLQIWTEVLGVESVGIDDNFWELGGHSLFGIQIISRIRQTFGIELSLRNLFDAPTIAQLAINLPTATTTEAIAPGFYRENRPAIIPLSFAQQRLWFLNRLDPNSRSYHLFYGLQWEGPLTIMALEQSINTVIDRHEVWRTTFPATSGQPYQRIAEFTPVALPLDDLESLSPRQQAEEIQRLTHQEVNRPFDLEQGPLLRFRLLRLNAQNHIFLFTCHHIVFDDWSYGIFLQELAILYHDFCSGQGSSLPPLPIQYADFSLWQRQGLSGDALEIQLQYWLQQLEGTLPILNLPTDRPRPSQQVYRGGFQSLTLSPELTQNLRILSQARGVTPFTTLLATFKILLHRYSGQDDLIVGTPIAGRTHQETEVLMGFLINTLALRTNLAGNPSFNELLARVREVTLGAYAHQSLPFEKLVEALKPERDLSRNPIFDVLINYFSPPQALAPFHRLQSASLPRLADLDSKFALTLYIQEEGDRLTLAMAYQTALFSAERITGMLQQLRDLLVQIVADPTQSIRRYSLVHEESQRLLPDLRASLPEPDLLPMPQRFADTVALYPDRLAVCQGSQQWSYNQLWQSSTAIAQTLLGAGLQPGEVVAVSGSRSLGLIASMMGVLLSGGILLTIASNRPAARQQIMLDEAKARYRLQVGESEPPIENKDDSLRLLLIDPPSGYPLACDLARGSERALPQISPDDGAYIFFTSGTSGIPKGVLGNHKGLSHFLDWQRQTFEIGAGDRVAQITGLSFDVVLREIFLPLTSGATLCLPDPRQEIVSPQLISWLEEQQVTVLHTVPALAQSWLMTRPPHVTLAKLRWIFFAGEPLTDKLIQQWRGAFPQAGAMINLYGPTETTLAKCYYPVPEDILPGIQPIGYPLPQTQALVLGDRDRLCGIGEPGEIVLRTPFRTVGYINAPSRFVPNPQGQATEDCLYYTGDGGRYRPDGTLEILGRLDRQIKIRGVRIELGEIEKRLLQHPSVQSVVVVTHPDPTDNPALIAYFVPQQGAIASTELRQFLLRLMPEVMVPSLFIPLDTLPLTPNGKIDHRALPLPNFASIPTASSPIEPRTLLEKMLVGLWQNVLPIKTLGIRDSFFDLGGHSLLAVQLFSQIQQRLGYEIPLATLYQAPNIEKLAHLIESQGWKPRWSSLVAINPQGKRRPIFFHGGSADALTWAGFARQLGDDQPFYALQRHDLEGQPNHELSLEEMATLCVQEIQTVQPQGPYGIGGHCFGGTMALEIARQIQAQGEEVDLLFLVDAYAPLAPLLAQVQAPGWRSQWHQFDFWLAKSYYYHAPKLWQGGLTDKLHYLLDKGVKKLQYQRKRHAAVPIAQSQPSTAEISSVVSLPYELRYRLAGQANRQARNAYVPQIYSGTITLLRAQKQTMEWAFGKDLGWESLSTAPIKTYIIPGFFGNLFNGRSLPLLVAQVQACLEESDPED